jgi:hypothetical protein
MFSAFSANSAVELFELIRHAEEAIMKACSIRGFVRPLFPSVLLFALLFPFTSHAGGMLSLSKRAVYEETVNVPKVVKDQCRMEAKVIEYVQYFSKKNFDKIVLVDDPSEQTPGTALNIRITGAVAPKGGATTGIKSLTIKGTLWQDGKLAGTFAARRVTSGGASLVGYKGTCSMLGRSAKRLGKDVAAWLENPSMNAKLGDLKK